MDQDRNLLFGVFAVQLRKIDSRQLANAAAAWATDPAQELGTLLVEAGAISDLDQILVDNLVAQAVRDHEDDASAALESFGGEGIVRDSFCNTIGRSDGRWEYESPEAFTDSTVEIQEIPGRYQELSEQGRGGMGRVLLVHDHALGRDIVLKELLPLPDDPESSTPSPVRQSASMMARFLQEAKVTGQLEHPSVAPVYELGKRQDGTLYYTMKLVRGKTLAQALDEAKTIRERMALLPQFGDLCQAVAYAHSRHVIHRDLKPANIMVGEFGETVILDWGLAKIHGQPDIHADKIERTVLGWHMGAEGDLEKTAPGEILGTPSYMAPEQARGQLELIDDRTDIYGLGAILYHMLTGRTPFEWTTIGDVLTKVANESPPAVSELEPNAPPELAAICQKAIQRNPKNRYQSAKELAEEVRRFQAGARVRAYEYAMTEHVYRWVNRNKVVVALASAAVAVLLVMAGYSYFQIADEREQAIKSRDEAQTAQAEAERARSAEAEARTEAESKQYISGLLLARTFMNDRAFDAAQAVLDETLPRYRGWEWGYLMNQCNAHEFSFTGRSGSLVDAFYSTDGAKVITVESDGRVSIWDAVSGLALEEIGQRNFHFVGLEQSPDGSRFATRVNLPVIVAELWDANSGEVLGKAGSLALPAIDAIAFSPDSSRFVAVSVENSAVIWNSETYKAEYILRGHASRVRCLAWSSDGRHIVTGSDDRTFILWDAANGQSIRVSDPLPTSVVDVWFSPDSKSIVTQSEDGVLESWEAESGKHRQRFRDSGSLITTLSFVEQGSGMLTASTDGALLLWNFDSATTQIAYAGHSASVLDFALSPDGKLLASASRDRTVRIWRQKTGQLLHTFEGHSNSVRSVRFSSDGTHVLSASSDGSAKVWAIVLDADSPLRTITAHEGSTRGVEWASASERFRTFGTDGSLRTWNMNALDLESTLCGVCRFFTYDVVSTENDQLLALNCADEIVLVDPNDPESLISIEGEFSRIDLSPSGNRVAGSRDKGIVEVYDTSTGELLLEKSLHDDFIQRVVFAPDGDSFVTLSNDHSAKRWNASTGELLASYAGHTDTVYLGAFSNDGRLLVTASGDKSAIVWDAQKGIVLHVLAGHQTPVTDVAFSPDGLRLATATEDGQVRIWDAGEGDELIAFTESEEDSEESRKAFIESLGWSPDGQSLVVTYRDGRVDVLRARPWHLDEVAGVSNANTGDLSTDGVTREDHSGSSVNKNVIEVLGTSFRLVSRLKALRSMVQSAQIDETQDSDVLIDESPHARSLLRIGIRPGDRIVSINGQPMSAATVAARVSKLIDSMRAGSLRKYEMELERDDEPIVLRARSFTSSSEEVTLHMTPKEALQIVSLLNVGLKLYEGSFREMQQSAARDWMGIYLEGDDLDGALVAGFDTSTEEDEAFSTMVFELMERLGLVLGDRIIKINGQYVDNMSDMWVIVQSMLEQAKLDRGGRIIIDASRGSFRHVKIFIEMDL